MRRDYWFPDHAVRFSILSDRARFAPWGLFGGQAARPAHYIRDPEGRAEPLNSKVSIELQPGEVLSVQTPGGGGYGLPLDRDPQAVLQDVRLGKVTAARARDVYGVVVTDADTEVDLEATTALRGARQSGTVTAVPPEAAAAT
jgi:N-methylhydantoinase B